MFDSDDDDEEEEDETTSRPEQPPTNLKKSLFEDDSGSDEDQQTSMLEEKANMDQDWNWKFIFLSSLICFSCFHRNSTEEQQARWQQAV